MPAFCAFEKKVVDIPSNVVLLVFSLLCGSLTKFDGIPREAIVAVEYLSTNLSNDGFIVFVSPILVITSISLFSDNETSKPKDVEVVIDEIGDPIR